MKLRNRILAGVGAVLALAIIALGVALSYDAPCTRAAAPPAPRCSSSPRSQGPCRVTTRCWCGYGRPG